MDKNFERNIRINGIKNGLLLGVIVVLLTIFSFYFITALNRSPLLFVGGPIIFRILIPMILVIFLCFKLRKSIGGLWTFKQATTGIFIVFFTAYLVNVVGIYLVFDQLIEPNSLQKTQIAAVNAKTRMMEQKGFDQQKIAASVADLKKTLTGKQGGSFFDAIEDNVTVLLFLFIFALIFAALLRNAEYVSTAGQNNR